MPHDNPDLPEMVRTVREFIDGVTTRLDGLHRYHALCAVYLLDIVLRELGEWRRVPSVDDERLRAWLDAAPDMAPAALVKDLCSAIRGGAYDDDMPGLLAVLIDHVRAKVAVSKPDVLAG